MKLRIGSRGSDLAMWQARYVAGRLGDDVEIIVIKTQGDEVQNLSLDKLEGKGFFTKEIEVALLKREIEIAVHSMKDLPTESPPSLIIGAVPPRAPVADVLVMRKAGRDNSLPLSLPQGARVGTSSLRRKAQLLAARPDLRLVDLRGNVPTRARKVIKGELDAVVLAEAGLTRLALEPELLKDGAGYERIPLDVMLPAPAQGALAVQVRKDVAEAKERVKLLHDVATEKAVLAERALLSRFGGGCQLPLGAYCEVKGRRFYLRAVVAAPDGSAVLKANADGDKAEEVVAEVHRALVSQGAGRYL